MINPFTLLFEFSPQISFFIYDPSIFIAIVVAVILAFAAKFIEWIFKAVKQKWVTFALFFPFAAIILFFFYELSLPIIDLLGITDFFRYENVFSIFSDFVFILSLIIIAAVFIVPLGLLALFIPRTKISSIITDAFIGPWLEELIYRFLLLSIILNAGFSLITAVGFTSLLFAIAPNHVFQKSENTWSGYYRSYIVFIQGIFYGYFAFQFGIIFAMLAHSFSTLVGHLLYYFKTKK